MRDLKTIASLALAFETQRTSAYPLVKLRLRLTLYGWINTMKKVIDRFVAEDINGTRYTVMCIQETVESNDPGTALQQTNLSYQTTVGEILTTSDNASFNVVDTNRFLHRVNVARSEQGVLRFRGFSMRAVPIY
jgi:hypothetical protein